MVGSAVRDRWLLRTAEPLTAVQMAVHSLGPDRIARGLRDDGVDLFHGETIMDLANARIAMGWTPVTMSAQIEGHVTTLDGTTATAFVDFARGYNPAFIGLSGDTQVVADAADEVCDSGRCVDFVLIRALWGGAEHTWLHSPESLAVYFKTLLARYPISHIGISYGVRPEFIRALRRID